MICTTEGTVTALVRHGFTILTPSGDEVDVYTLTPGPRLALSVGDRVRVLGGPSAKGVGFACSLIVRTSETGEEIRVQDWPSAGA